jgi:pimeloyl-ACP methyl ester carboxylesterase
MNARISPHYAATLIARSPPTISKVPRVQLNGHPTWVVLPKRKGKTVVVLHGGLSSSASLLRTLGPRLSKRFALAAFDRRGHGRTADTDAPFSYDDMALETIAFLELLDRRAYLLGHSDGANVALLVALKRPDLLHRVALVGANYHYDGLMPMDDFTPDSPDFEQFALDFATRSPDGVEHAAAVVEKSLHLVKTQPTLAVDDLHAVSVPALVMAGDDDVARLDHTVSLYEAIPGAQLAILPGTSHAILKERPKESARLIKEFFLGPVEPVTQYPIRRAKKSRG